MAPEAQAADRLVLTVRTSAERHADGEYHASISGRTALGTFAFDDATADVREEARVVAIGHALHTLGVDIAAGVIAAPTRIDVVDAPAEEGR